MKDQKSQADTMHIEDGLVYCFQFKQNYRATAAKLAYKLDSLEGKNSTVKHIIRATKAFFSRQITVTSESMKNPALQPITERLTGDIQSRSIATLTTTTGIDPIKKRGDAQHYARQTVVRTWPFKNLKHPGHASLSIKDSSPDREHQKHVYLSWWPAKDINSTFNRFLKLIKMGDMSTKIARTQDSYKMDKREEISTRTQARLISGAGNYDDLEGYGDYFSEAVKQEARNSPIKPRPRQVQLRDTRVWGMQADKVYIPLVGPNTDLKDHKPVFTLFGLNEFKMEKYARQRYRDAKNEQAHYGLASRNDSCTGVVLTTLRQGGADYYTKTDDAMLVTDPNLLHKISIRLHNRIDDLNKKASFLSEQLQPVSGTEDPDLSEPSEVEQSDRLRSRVDQLEQTMKSSGTTHKAHGHIKRVTACLKDFNNSKCTLDDLTPKAIRLVETLYKSCDKFKDDENSMLMLQPALEAFEIIKDYITEACSEESSKIAVTNTPVIRF